MSKIKNLLEATQVLSSTIKGRINKEIAALLKPTYFDHIPLKQIFSILQKYGVVALQEDATEWEGFLLGGVSKTEQVYFELGFAGSEDKDGIYHNIVKNTTLALSYYKMPSGRYEVLSHLT